MEKTIKQRLEEVITLKRVNPAQAQLIFNLYKELVNSKFIGCGACASSIRQAYNGLKIYYNNNYGNN